MFKLTPLTALFFLCLLGEFLIPALFPAIKVLGFLPFILFALSRLSLPKLLWCSTFAGLIVDLYSYRTPFGFFAINYLLTSLIMVRYKKFFSSEKPTSFALYGALYSMTSTLLHFLLYPLVDIHLKIKPLTILTDLVCMTFVDTAYTLLWALFPLMLYNYLSRPKNLLLYKAKLKRIKLELSRITR